MSSPRLPDFLLLGAPKCGTSALHAALARHPELFLSEPKEPKFFLTDGPPPSSGGGPGDLPTWGEHVWRRDDYEALFAAAPAGARCGESTVFYLYDLDAQRRIRTLLPDARLVAVLRDPAERAHSNWAHLRGAGLEPEADFADGSGPRTRADRRGLGALLALRRPRSLRRAARPPVQAVPARAGAADPLPRAARRAGGDRGPGVPVPRRRHRRDHRGAAAQRAAGRVRADGGVSATERAAALPRFADDVPRVAELTSWDLSDWLR